jgi:maleylacetoacetate isomerase
MSSDSSIVLHTYWRSSCSWRVRIALHWKGIEYTSQPVNLLKGEHKDPSYVEKNPTKLVPTLDIDGISISQSIAILECMLLFCHA